MRIESKSFKKVMHKQWTITFDWAVNIYQMANMMNAAVLSGNSSCQLKDMIKLKLKLYLEEKGVLDTSRICYQ